MLAASDTRRGTTLYTHIFRINEPASDLLAHTECVEWLIGGRVENASAVFEKSRSALL